MQIKVGDKIENITLPSIDDSIFEYKSVKGKKILLTFYRFAACPMCNLRINELIKSYDSFGDNFTHIAIFDSSLDNLKRFTNRHNAPFPILADDKFQYFKKYDVKRSFLVFLWSQIIRVNRQIKAMLKGYIPWAFNGYISTLPVDVLINEEGIVSQVKYAKDLSDHIPIKNIQEFTSD
ncbi:MAG: hypothetical protein CL762_03570 [Chloroflexi bacterium]|nr:hypothetical protein [Chloroflexota bacterium]|tara:strand:- start:150 stop:683 length:534 start_codon:yes stop_codon:yes gene_type:complete